MILSGPKSYYEEYLRKRDSDRSLSKPPSVLTDRNSYINFLEVQLERVSAACISVQAYEDRFNDMQGLIVSLEQRVAQSTRLVSLAQQCTEEVRAEALQRQETEAATFRNYRAESQKSIRELTNKVDSLEKHLGGIPALEGKIKALEKRIQDHEAMIRTVDLDGKQEWKKLSDRADVMDSVKDELYALIESNRASVSRVAFDVEENASRLNTHVSGVEMRLNDTLKTSGEELRQDLHTAKSKASNQYDELKTLIEVKDQATISTARKQYTAINEEMDGFRRKWEEDLESLSDRVKHDTASKIDRAQASFACTVENLQSICEQQAGAMCDFEHGVSTQMDAVQSGLQDISAYQKSVEKQFHDKHSGLEDRVAEVGDSSKYLADSLASQSKVIEELQEKQQDVQHSLSMMTHGWNTAAGSSTLQPGGASMAFMSPPPSGKKAATAGTAGLEIPTGATAGLQPGVPSYYGPPPYYGGFPFWGDPSHTAAASAGAATGAGTGAGKKKAAAVRAKSPTVSSRAKVSSKGSKNSAKSDSIVEVLNKFIDIYDSDQVDIVKRLDELGAARPCSSTSAPTGATATAAGQPTKATAGEVLGNFFLNYKKDRMEILSRLGSLSPSRSQRELEEEEEAKSQPLLDVFNSRRGSPVRDTSRSGISADSYVSAGGTGDDSSGHIQQENTHHHYHHHHHPPRTGLGNNRGAAGGTESGNISPSMRVFMHKYHNRDSNRNSNNSRNGTNVSYADIHGTGIFESGGGGGGGSADISRANSSHQSNLIEPTSRLLRGTVSSVASGRGDIYLEDSEGNGAEHHSALLARKEALARYLQRQKQLRERTYEERMRLTTSEFDRKAAKPSWRLPNTYQSPQRRNSSSSSGVRRSRSADGQRADSKASAGIRGRSASQSPSTRTAINTLINQQQQQQRSEGAVSTNSNPLPPPLAVAPPLLAAPPPPPCSTTTLGTGTRSNPSAVFAHVPAALPSSNTGSGGDHHPFGSAAGGAAVGGLVQGSASRSSTTTCGSETADTSTVVTNTSTASNVL